MSSQNKRPFTFDEIEELFPSELPPGEDRRAEMLQSELTEVFEKALCRGMPPLDALAVILGWESAEFSRVPPGQMDKSR